MRSIWKRGWGRAGSRVQWVGAELFKDVTSRCSKWRPGWRLANKDKHCHAMVLVVHVTWMSVLIPLCYCPLRSHEEQIIRAASDCLHITESRLATHAPRISCLIIQRACGFTQLLQAKKGKEDNWLIVGKGGQRGRSGSPCDRFLSTVLQHPVKTEWAWAGWWPAYVKILVLTQKGVGQHILWMEQCMQAFGNPRCALQLNHMKQHCLPQCIVGWVIRFQQSCKENKSGTKQTLANEQAYYLSAAKYVNTEAD